MVITPVSQNLCGITSDAGLRRMQCFCTFVRSRDVKALRPMWPRGQIIRLSKVADFNPPHLHLVPPQSNVAKIFGIKKLVPEISCGFVCVILRLAVLVELRLVTDRRTGRQTDTGPWLVAYRGCIATHSKKVPNDSRSVFKRIHQMSQPVRCTDALSYL